MTTVVVLTFRETPLDLPMLYGLSLLLAPMATGVGLGTARAMAGAGVKAGDGAEVEHAAAMMANRARRSVRKL